VGGQLNNVYIRCLNEETPRHVDLHDKQSFPHDSDPYDNLSTVKIILTRGSNMLIIVATYKSLAERQQNGSYQLCGTRAAEV
jgi:hypothetical protein